MKLSKESLKQLLISLNPQETSTRKDLEIDCPECKQRECRISLDKENHLWGCLRANKCGVKGNIFSLKKYGIFIKTEDKTTENRNFKRKTLKVFISQDEEIILPDISLPLGFRKIMNDSYLESRGFIERDYEYWEVGRTSFGNLKDYVIFPIKLDNSLKAYIARNVDLNCSKKHRYNNSKNDFAKLLGGIDKFDNCETVILCEGKFDVINVTRLMDLYDCENLRSCCTFGAKISQNQINLLRSKNVKNIILLFDGDVIKKIKQISFELSLYFNVRVAILEGVDVDAGNCNLHQLLKALENTYNPLDFNLNKIVKRTIAS